MLLGVEGVGEQAPGWQKAEAAAGQLWEGRQRAQASEGRVP